MSGDLPVYALYAIRYATRAASRSEHFIGGDPHDGPMPMDYFCWLAISDERRFVIDCGFTEEVSIQRKRTYLRNPLDALELLGVRAAEVDDVIITHLHYDHVGNFDRFPKARFHLQEAATFERLEIGRQRGAVHGQQSRNIADARRRGPIERHQQRKLALGQPERPQRVVEAPRQRASRPSDMEAKAVVAHMKGKRERQSVGIRNRFCNSL